jgi:hypothetical protein
MVCGNLVYFTHVGILCQEKCGNPGHCLTLQSAFAWLCFSEIKIHMKGDQRHVCNLERPRPQYFEAVVSV